MERGGRLPWGGEGPVGSWRWGGPPEALLLARVGCGAAPGRLEAVERRLRLRIGLRLRVGRRLLRIGRRLRLGIGLVEIALPVSEARSSSECDKHEWEMRLVSFGGIDRNLGAAGASNPGCSKSVMLEAGALSLRSRSVTTLRSVFCACRESLCCLASRATSNLKMDNKSLHFNDLKIQCRLGCRTSICYHSTMMPHSK